MKFFLFFIITLFSINNIYAANKSLSCDDIPILVDNAFKEHINKKLISPENIAKSLDVLIEKINVYAPLISESEQLELKQKFKTKSDIILNNILLNNCSDYSSIITLAQERLNNLFLFSKSHDQTKISNDKEYIIKISNLFIKNILEKINNSDLQDFLEETPKLNENVLILNSLLLTLDPHTEFISNESLESFNKELSGGYYKGIGISYIKVKSPVIGFKITNLIPNSPASKNNIEKDDIIIGINDKKITLENMNDDVFFNEDMLHLNVYKKNQNKNIDIIIKKDLIEDNSDKISTSIKKINNKNFLVIYIPSFYEDQKTETSVTKDVYFAYKEALKHNKINGIILDLRDNPGGFLSQAVALSSLFIKNPIVVQLIDSFDKPFNPHPLKGKNYFDLIQEPMIVLINKKSASASEILAGALQVYGRALIVGDSTSFGKGTAQTYVKKIEDLNYGLLKVTQNQFFLANGQSTQNIGIKSDIIIPSYSEFYKSTESNHLFSLSSNTINSVHYSPIALSTINLLKKKSQARTSNNKKFSIFKNESDSLMWLKSIDFSFFRSENDFILNESAIILNDFINSQN